MKLFFHIKAGVKLAPAYIITLYYLVAALDMFSTYLVTPDFRHEVNWFVVLLHLNWTENVLLYSTIVFINSIFFIISLNYINSISELFSTQRAKNKSPWYLLQNLRLIFSYVFIGCFYSHLITISFFVFNNILNYFYVSNINSHLSSLGNWYVIQVTSKNPNYLLYMQLFTIIIGYSIAFFKVRHVISKFSQEPIGEKG